MQKTTSKTVFGPTVEEAYGTAAPTEMAPAQNAAPSFYDNRLEGPYIGGFQSAAGKVGGIRDISVGNGNLDIGVSPLRGGAGGARLTLPFKKGGKVSLAVKPIWDKDRPKDLGKPKSLSVKKKKAAKARAKAAGRPYPNAVDNIAMAKKKKGK